MKTKCPGIKWSTIDTINNYVLHGLPPGGFVWAVLSNNLMEALRRADMENRFAIYEICDYIYNETPAGCHGSPEIVAQWIEKGGLNGRTA